MKVDLNDQYLFFSVHFVEEKRFSSRLKICLHMSSKVSQNAPKVVHFIVLIIVILLFFLFAVLVSAYRV